MCTCESALLATHSAVVLQPGCEEPPHTCSRKLWQATRWKARLSVKRTAQDMHPQQGDAVICVCNSCTDCHRSQKPRQPVCFFKVRILIPAAHGLTAPPSYTHVHVLVHMLKTRSLPR